jgi:hypothetical protein
MYRAVVATERAATGRGNVSDPVGFVLLSAIAVLGLTTGIVGLRRGRTVALIERLRFSRTDNPFRFWYGVAFQLIIGLACLVLAVGKATQ